MDGSTGVADKVQAHADQAVSGALKQVLHLTQVGRVGGAGACGNIAQGVATEAYVSVVDDNGVAAVFADGDAIGVVNAVVTIFVGHAGACGSQLGHVAGSILQCGACGCGG